MFALIKWSLLRGSSRGSNGLSSLLNSVDMHNACTLLKSMRDSQMVPMECCHRTNLPCWNQFTWTGKLLKSMSSSQFDPMNQNLLSSSAYSWWLPQLMSMHFWEGDSSMEHKSGRIRRWWGRCPRKNKLHFVRKDRFIDIGFGEYKRLSWYSGRLLLLANCLMGLKEKIFLMESGTENKSVKETKW